MAGGGKYGRRFRAHSKPVESSSLRASSAESTGVLPRRTVLGPAYGTHRIDFQNPSGGQVIEEPADRSQMLLDGGLGN
jgi:hypothetical protein